MNKCARYRSICARRSILPSIVVADCQCVYVSRTSPCRTHRRTLLPQRCASWKTRAVLWLQVLRPRQINTPIRPRTRWQIRWQSSSITREQDNGHLAAIEIGSLALDMLARHVSDDSAVGTGDQHEAWAAWPRCDWEHVVNGYTDLLLKQAIKIQLVQPGGDGGARPHDVWKRRGSSVGSRSVGIVRNIGGQDCRSRDRHWIPLIPTRFTICKAAQLSQNARARGAGWRATSQGSGPHRASDHAFAWKQKAQQVQQAATFRHKVAIGYFCRVPPPPPPRVSSRGGFCRVICYVQKTPVLAFLGQVQFYI